MISFTYLEPADADQALDALAKYGDDAKLIAGGTGLINMMKQQLLQPTYLIGLRHLPGLNAIAADDGLRIGSLCTHRTIETSAIVHKHAWLLAETCRHVATIRIRVMATLGGTLAHADPNQDIPPALIALDAQVRVRSKQSERRIPLAEFFSGYYETVLRPDELITETFIPALPPGTGTSYLKFLPQTRDDYATVSVAARVTIQSGRIIDSRVALGGAASTPLRAEKVEDALRGQVASAGVLQEAAATVSEVVDPTSDFRGSADYKRQMAVVFVRRALTEAVSRAQASGGH